MSDVPKSLDELRYRLPEGMTVARVSATGEIRVSFNVYWTQQQLGLDFKQARERCEAVAYYTDDLADAWGTAQQMARIGIAA